MPEAVADETRINRTVLRLIKEDLTMLDVDAFVFYAANDLALGSGFGTAVSVRGGPTVQEELEKLAPVETGQAVVSAAGKLKAEHIIHAVGPKFQEGDTEGKLRTTMRNTLKRAEENGIKRLALPAMGAGYYMIPPDQLTERQVQHYILYVRDDLGVAKGTFAPIFYGIKFFYVNTLGREWALFTKKKSAGRAGSGCPMSAAMRIAAA